MENSEELGLKELALAELSTLLGKNLRGQSDSVFRRVLLLYCVDFLLTFFLFGVVIVGFWRGVWLTGSLILELTLPEVDCAFSNVILGIIVLTFDGCLTIFQPDIRTFINSKCDNFYTKILSKAFAIVSGALRILYWKSLWDALLCGFPNDLVIVSMLTLNTGLFLLFSVFVEGSRTLIDRPYGLSIDDDERQWFLLETLRPIEIETSLRRRLFIVMLDVSILTLVIFIWFAVWTLEDAFLNHLEFSHFQSGLISVGLSFSTSSFTAVISFPLLLMYKSPTINSFTKNFVDNLMTFIGGISVINTYRGYWYIIDSLFLPENPTATAIIGLLVAILALLAFGITQSVQPGTTSTNFEHNVIIPYFYLSHLALEVKETSEKWHG